jgi:hypothetical protein
MKRKLVGGLALLFVVGAAAPTAAAAKPRNAHRIEVDGTFRGAGGYETTCEIVSEVSDGTFHDPVLGHGSYNFRICLALVDDPITFVGSFSLTTASGATLDGSISGTYDPSAGIILPVTILGGTQRFRHARGSLTIGPIREHDFTNCDPRAPACLDWKDSGPITGTITHVATP